MLVCMAMKAKLSSFVFRVLAWIQILLLTPVRACCLYLLMCSCTTMRDERGGSHLSLRRVRLGGDDRQWQANLQRLKWMQQLAQWTVVNGKTCS